MKTIFHRSALIRLGIILLTNLTALGVAADPQVVNVQAVQRAGTKLVDITYDLSSASSPLSVVVSISTNSGATYDLPATHFTGDVGSGVVPGTGKAIAWDAGADWDGHYSESMRVKVTATAADPALPPDPATVATAVSNGVVTLIGQSTAFLYTGDNPIQTGVASGTISAVQVAVLRGRVLDRLGAPLSGVTASINNHPELGQTLTRTNGQYDLAVNGGGILHLNFAKNGYLSVQRTLNVPWQNYIEVSDVNMCATDTNAVSVDMGAAGWQAASGPIVTDSDGSRRPVLLVPPGTRAWVYPAAGGTQEVSQLTLRFSEFTVGTNGPAAMPGDLPPTVAYTYALEVQAEEEQTRRDGAGVIFNTNVFLYLDNFLAYPEGMRIPLATYRDTVGAWVPEPDGRVLRLAGTNAAGLAMIILNTNGATASDLELAALSLTDAERRLLAEVYPGATQCVWRTPMAHFTPCDLNVPHKPVNDQPPDVIVATATVGQSDNTIGPGAYGKVDVENQVFEEMAPVVGTPFSLHYRSQRMSGYGGMSSLTMTLCGAVVPHDLERIDLIISAAGGSLVVTNYAAASNLVYRFTWDGKDAYGRQVHGYQPVYAKITYQYPSVVAIPPEFQSSFSWVTGEQVPGGLKTRQKLSGFQQYLESSVGVFRSQPAASAGLGGWTLNVHHTYDPLSGRLFLGNGQVRRLHDSPAGNAVMRTVAGNGASSWSDIGDGGPATNAVLIQPCGVAVAPDKSFYISDTSMGSIRKVNAGGIIQTVASVAAANLALAPDGTVVFSDGVSRVKRLATNGTITIVAGNGIQTYAGDGGPAMAASLRNPAGVAVAPDGSIYVADKANNRVRRISPDGIIGTVAGKGASGVVGGFSGDGGPATNAALNRPIGIALGQDGSLYIADSENNRIRKINPGGIINTVAGNGTQDYPDGDGGSATNAGIGAYDVAIASDGSLFILEWYAGRIRKVTTDGNVATLAGNGALLFAGDGGPAQTASMNYPVALALAPDGSVYVADRDNKRIRRIAPVLGGPGASDISIASSDGRQLFDFDPAGRHLRTRNAMSGSNIYVFAYAANGCLASITDAYGNLTSIEYDATGRPTGIVAPYGQRTTLATDACGLLTSIANPKMESTKYGYTTNGLMTSVTGAKGAEYLYTTTYDSEGRVQCAVDPEGGQDALGARLLAVSRSGGGFEVTSTSALGRVTTTRVETCQLGYEKRTVTSPDATRRVIQTFNSGTNRTTEPFGTVITVATAPDPLYGMMAPYESLRIVRLPSGLSSTCLVTRSLSLGNDGSWTSMTSIVSASGRTATNVYDRAARTMTIATPAGRVNRVISDAQGKPIAVFNPGVHPITNEYDEHGHLVQITQGQRVTRYTYAASGFLETTVDVLGRTNRMEYDLAGRPTATIRADGTTIGCAFDEHGNQTSVTPPGRSAHLFTHSKVDLPATYTPPGGVAAITTFNADRQPVMIARGDGKATAFSYDAAGRVATVDLDGAQIAYTYLTNGLLASVSNVGVQGIAYTYDGSLFQALDMSGVITGRVAYSYDADFRVTGVSVNDGGAESRQYTDADGLLTGVGDCRLDRAPHNGQLTCIALGSATNSIQCNAYGEVTNTRAYCLGSVILEAAQARDALGRVTNIIETADGATVSNRYAYDLAGRLVMATTNGTGAGTNFYSYDLNGNRTNWTANGVAYSAAYDLQDRLTRMESYGKTNFYYYNGAGDLTNKTVLQGGEAVTTYAYDGGGNLLAAGLPGSTSITYKLDAHGRCAAKFVNGVFTQGFIHGIGRLPLAEIDHQSNVVSRFVYTSADIPPLYMIRSGVSYLLVYDSLGSLRRCVRADTGEIVQSLDYDPWGRVVRDQVAAGFHPLPFGFAGGLYDRDTGLVRFGTRDYDADTGRWTTRDPIGFAGGDPNLYAYCYNDPLNFNDRNGCGAAAADLVLWIANSAAETPEYFLGPFEGYATMEEAGIAAINAINPTSQQQDQEYAGTIYMVNGLYYYNAPISFAANYSFPNPLIPAGATAVATYHTHGGQTVGPKGEDWTTFSGQDMDNADSAGKPEIMGNAINEIQVRYPRGTNPKFRGAANVYIQR